MKSKWRSERKWDTSLKEQRFENLLVQNGYTVKAYREYVSRTDYLISKGNTEMEWNWYDSTESTAKEWFAHFEKAFLMKMKLESLKREATEKGIL